MSTRVYSVPKQAQLVFEDGILNNPLIAKNASKDLKQYAARLRFEGSDSPVIPINWRFAESISALKAYEGVLVMALLKQKYGVAVEELVINTYVQ
jgi:hypothetical protein